MRTLNFALELIMLIWISVCFFAGLYIIAFANEECICGISLILLSAWGFYEICTMRRLLK